MLPFSVIARSRRRRGNPDSAGLDCFAQFVLSACKAAEGLAMTQH